MATLITSKSLTAQKNKITKLAESLKGLQRQVSDAIQQSAGDGPHDNAPFDALRSEINIKGLGLGNLQREIDGCTIKDYPKRLDGKIVQYGVGVVFEMNSEETNFKIVGFGDSDPEKGRIFYNSPLAKKLMGRKEGETFDIEINGQKSKIRIKKIYVIDDPEL